MGFNGTRLRDVRELFNLSQEELGRKINLPNEKILKYENGIEKPSFKVQIELNNFFDLKIPFFNREDPVTKVTNFNEVSFDSKYLNEPKSKERELQFINMSDSFLNEIFKYIDLGDTSIMSILKEVQSMKDNRFNIDKIAKRVRELLGIDQKNNNLMSAIEKSGVFVLERGLNKSIGSYSTWTDTNRPYIVLKNNIYGSDRLFDLAHEFGHLLLHRGNDFRFSDVDGLKKLEKEANQFANALLLEKNFFKQNFKRMINDKSNPKQYLSLKKYYGISIIPIEKRARKLDLISKSDSDKFYREFKKIEFDKFEPYDLDVPMYIPGKIYTILNSLNSQDLNAVYDTFGINKNFLYKVFLRKIDDSPSEDGVSNSRVINIKSNKSSRLK